MWQKSWLYNQKKLLFNVIMQQKRWVYAKKDEDYKTKVINTTQSDYMRRCDDKTVVTICQQNWLYVNKTWLYNKSG